MKGFVQSSQGFPHIAARHQKRASGLFHGTGEVEIAIKIAIAAIHGIRRPQPIYAEKLKNERCRRGQAPDRKSALRFSIEIQKLSGGEAILRAGLDERVNSG
jgi:hypothetical protein